MACPMISTVTGCTTPPTLTAITFGLTGSADTDAARTASRTSTVRIRVSLAYRYPVASCRSFRAALTRRLSGFGHSLGYHSGIPFHEESPGPRPLPSALAPSVCGQRFLRTDLRDRLVSASSARYWLDRGLARHSAGHFYGRSVSR